MGENLAAALRYLGATEVESWMANADEIAGVTAVHFEQTSRPVTAPRRPRPPVQSPVHASTCFVSIRS